ncbi:hypothetical protein AB0J20_20735 [Micromonospora costi]|uniref:hypothetical protein n=1 Tax=Micromonospora costi TaxID=1530042 RepID=UPI0033C0FF83
MRAAEGDSDDAAGARGEDALDARTLGREGRYHHLARNRWLLHPRVSPRFFRLERIRGLFGLFAFSGAGLVGFLVSPPVALGIFLFLPAFYVTSAVGLDVRGRLRRRRSG